MDGSTGVPGKYAVGFGQANIGHGVERVFVDGLLESVDRLS